MLHIFNLNYLFFITCAPDCSFNSLLKLHMPCLDIDNCNYCIISLSASLGSHFNLSVQWWFGIKDELVVIWWVKVERKKKKKKGKLIFSWFMFPWILSLNCETSKTICHFPRQGPSQNCLVLKKGLSQGGLINMLVKKPYQSTFHWSWMPRKMVLHAGQVVLHAGQVVLHAGQVVLHAGQVVKLDK